MVKGITLPELATELKAQQTAKRDYVINTRFVKFVPNGTTGSLTFTGPNGDKLDIALSENALKDLCGLYHVPMQYVDQMRFGYTEAKRSKLIAPPSIELLAENLNFWLSAWPLDRMIRTFQGLGPQDVIRAILSDSFRALDNWDLANVALPILQKHRMAVKSCQVTESRLYIQAYADDVTWDLNELRAKYGSHTLSVQEVARREGLPDLIRAGVVISNSEIGKGRLMIQFATERVACLNGLIHNELLGTYHTGRKYGGGDGFDDESKAREYFTDETKEADDTAYWLKVRDTIEHALNAEEFEKVAKAFAITMDVSLGSDTAKIVDATAQRFQLTEGEQKSFLEQLIANKVTDGSEEFTQFHAVNALTRIAQDAKDYDRAIELQRIGGQAIELPQKSFFSAN